MKKVLLSIFAVAALASCFQNEEFVGAGNNTPIEFAGAYVGGVTKAIDGSYSNTNMFDKFQVYGTLENNGVVANIFNGVDVMKGGAGWYYDDTFTTYWISGNTYNFKAVVAGNEAGETAVAVDANGMPTTITLSDASAQNDILYAEKLDINYTGNAEPVRFVFEHLLAKAKVSVRNIIPVDNGGYYVVKDVKLVELKAHAKAAEKYTQQPFPCASNLWAAAADDAQYYTSHMSKKNQLEFRTEGIQRASFACACLVFSLIGVPLAITARRKDTYTLLLWYSANFPARLPALRPTSFSGYRMFFALLLLSGNTPKQNSEVNIIQSSSFTKGVQGSLPCTPSLSLN